MKNKLGILIVVAMLATAFSCGQKAKTEEAAATNDSTTTVAKNDSTVKTAQDTVKSK